MAKGSISSRAIQNTISNASKLSSKDFKGLGTRTLTQIAARSRTAGAKARSGEGQRLAARAQRELNRRKKT